MWLLRAFLLCCGIALFTWLGFEYFPGHTYLQSDTQIYVPMIERLDAPGFLARDIVATRPHVAFTIYDEVTLALRRTAHLDWEKALVVQQLLCRAAAILGVYLLACSLGSPPAYAFLIAALLNLGGSLLGPAVLVVEYEPVPRGFAFGLILLALGLLAERQALLAGLIGGLALLYHPPTAAPFWFVSLVALALNKAARRHWKPLVLALVVTCLLLANLAQLQPEVVESQNFFGRLSERMIQLQLFRTRYDWVSLWAQCDMWHYLGFWIAGLWATARIWPLVRSEMRWHILGLPLIGILSVPVSYILLERLHLALIPQYQPARALLYTVVLSSVACGAAAVQAAQRKRFAETFAWFLPIFAVPVNIRWFDLLDPHTSVTAAASAVWITLALIATALTIFANYNWIRSVAVAVPALAIYALPNIARVETFPVLDKRPVAEVARWARDTTWGSSMFLFPDSGHEPFPGIFRALAMRALWVDWKSGGQVNYFESFAEEWYPRFEQTMDGKFSAARLEDMLSLPIDYYVLTRRHKLLDMKAVFENSAYVVYEAQDLRNASTSLRIGTED